MTTLIERQNEWHRVARIGGDAALSAATAAFAGVRSAVEGLRGNLEELGHPAVPGLVRNKPGLEERISRLLSLADTLPPALPLFWRTVGGISLVDSIDFKHVDFWDSMDMQAEFCDGVCVEACDEDWLEFAIEDLLNQDEDPDAISLIIPISPDAYHKDAISGGPAYGLDIHGGWLTPLEYFQWSGPRRPESAPAAACDFVSYLRTALLECAGFPAYFGLEEFEPIRQRLLRGVEHF